MQILPSKRCCDQYPHSVANTRAHNVYYEAGKIIFLLWKRRLRAKQLVTYN